MAQHHIQLSDHTIKLCLQVTPTRLTITAKTLKLEEEENSATKKVTSSLAQSSLPLQLIAKAI